MNFSSSLPAGIPSAAKLPSANGMVKSARGLAQTVSGLISSIGTKNQSASVVPRTTSRVVDPSLSTTTTSSGGGGSSLSVVKPTTTDKSLQRASSSNALEAHQRILDGKMLAPEGSRDTTESSPAFNTRPPPRSAPTNSNPSPDSAVELGRENTSSNPFFHEGSPRTDEGSPKAEAPQSEIPEQGFYPNYPGEGVEAKSEERPSLRSNPSVGSPVELGREDTSNTPFFHEGSPRTDEGSPKAEAPQSEIPEQGFYPNYPGEAVCIKQRPHLHLRSKAFAGVMQSSSDPIDQANNNRTQIDSLKDTKATKSFQKCPEDDAISQQSTLANKALQNYSVFVKENNGGSNQESTQQRPPVFSGQREAPKTAKMTPEEKTAGVKKLQDARKKTRPKDLQDALNAHANRFNVPLKPGSRVPAFDLPLGAQRGDEKTPEPGDQKEPILKTRKAGKPFPDRSTLPPHRPPLHPSGGAAGRNAEGIGTELKALGIKSSLR